MAQPPQLRHIRRYVACLACALLAVVLAAPAATAQQRYELTDGQWQAEPTYAPDTPQGKLQAVRRKLAADEPKQAQKLVEDWIEQYPNHPLMAQARLLRGDCRTARKDYYKALRDYEYVIRAFPASEEFFTALEREYEIARLYTSGVKRRLWGMRIVSAGDEGAELLIRVQERAPGSELGEKASITLADYYYDQNQMFNAAEAYDLFLLNYPQSSQREWAMRRLIQANLARFKGPQFDSTGLIEATQRLKIYEDEFPASADRIGSDALQVRINESLAEKDLLAARWYETRGMDVSAAYLYQRVIADHPQTAAAQDALERLKSVDTDILAGLAGNVARKSEPGPEPATDDTAPSAPEDPS